MKKREFRMKLEGKEGNSVAVLKPPFDVEEFFVHANTRGTINGFPLRSFLILMSGCHMMVVNKSIRNRVQIKAGDTVTVEMACDDSVRTMEVPAALKRRNSPKARPPSPIEKSSLLLTAKRSCNR